MHVCAPIEQNTHIYLFILYLDLFNCIHDLLELMEILSYDFFPLQNCFFLSLSFVKSNCCYYYPWQIGLRVLIRYSRSTATWLDQTLLVTCFVHIGISNWCKIYINQSNPMQVVIVRLCIE